MPVTVAYSLLMLLNGESKVVTEKRITDEGYLTLQRETE